MRLKKDLVIPAGTVFERIPGGMKREFGTGNYEATIATSKDTVVYIDVCEDELQCSDYFEKTE